MHSFMKRKADRDILEDETCFIDSTGPASKTLQNLEFLIEKHRTVKRISVEASGDPIALSEHKNSNEKNEIIYKGSSDSSLTFGEILREAKGAREIGFC